MQRWRWASQVVLVVKNLPSNVGDLRDMAFSFNPWPGRSPGGGHGSPLQHSCLENPTDRGAWWIMVIRVAQSQTQLKRRSTYTYRDRDRHRSLSGKKRWCCRCRPKAASLLENSLLPAHVSAKSLQMCPTLVWLWAHQAPLSMGFCRQEYRSRLSCPPPADFPYPGTEPRSPALTSGFFSSEPPRPTFGAIEVFKWLDGAHPHYRGQSALLKVHQLRR